MTSARRSDLRSTTALVAALTIALAAGLFAGAQTITPGPPMPYEDVGACPFEGCAYREWRAKAMVAVRTTRAAHAPVAFTIRKGETVTALTGIVVTTAPGKVRFRAPADLMWADLETVDVGGVSVRRPRQSGFLHVEPGDTLYLLTYHGEGSTVAWFKGRLYEELDGALAFFNAICTDDPSRCAGQIIEKPQRVWWVHVQNARGQQGWTAEPEKFDGKDALAR
jgi:hypothetical protein